MTALVIKLVQLSTIPLARVLFSVVIGDKSISIKEKDIDRTIRYVFVANHTGALDPLIICYSLAYNISKRLSPYRFFTKNSFFRNVFTKPILILFGCFRARRENGKPSGLNYGISLIKKGQTVVIFPEGKVSRLDRKIFPRTGVETLANMSHVQLVPARVKWNRKKGLWKSYSLAVGRPFDGKNMTAEQIMDVVYGLKFR